MPQAYGYLPDWSDVVPHEAKLVREAAERVLGGETMAGVARDWTLRGLRTRTGAMWTVHRLRDLLTSPRLWGMRTHHGEVVAVGTWPPILASETGARLQYLLADPSRRREPNHGRPTLLTGLLRCGKCGSRMVTRRSERGDMTYCCPSAPRGCNGVSVRQAAADAVVVEAVMVELEERRNLIPDAVASMPAGEVARAVACHATALRDAALDFYVRKVIDRSTFLTVRDAVDRSLHEQIVGAPPPPVPSALRSLYQDPRGSWPTMEHVARRAALGACIDHIVIYPSPRGGGRFRPERVEVVFPGQRSTGGPKPRTGDLIDPEWLMTTPEVADALDLCRESVQRMLIRGHLTGVKTNGHWLVKGADVIACRDLRNIVGVKRVRRSSRKFAEILREYNSRF